MAQTDTAAGVRWAPDQKASLSAPPRPVGYTPRQDLLVTVTGRPGSPKNDAPQQTEKPAAPSTGKAPEPSRKADPQKVVTEAQVLEYLRKGKARSTAQIATALHGDIEQVARVVTALARAGQIHKTASHRPAWRAVPKKRRQRSTDALRDTVLQVLTQATQALRFVDLQPHLGDAPTSSIFWVLTSLRRERLIQAIGPRGAQAYQLAGRDYGYPESLAPQTGAHLTDTVERALQAADHAMTAAELRQRAQALLGDTRKVTPQDMGCACLALVKQGRAERSGKRGDYRYQIQGRGYPHGPAPVANKIDTILAVLKTAGGLPVQRRWIVEQAPELAGTADEVLRQALRTLAQRGDAWRIERGGRVLWTAYAEVAKRAEAKAAPPAAPAPPVFELIQDHLETPTGITNPAAQAALLRRLAEYHLVALDDETETALQVWLYDLANQIEALAA